MPPRQKQGEGSNTLRKESAFYDLLLMVFRMTKRGDRPHWFLDLNSGSGVNANCDGSPLVAIRAAIDADRDAPVRLHFCDVDPERSDSLHLACFGQVLRLPPESEISVCTMDNADFLRHMTATILEEEGSTATGTVLCDPNGFPHGCPVDALDDFMRTFPRMDLILNLNLSLFAMVDGCERSKYEHIRKGFLDWPKLNALIERFHKQFAFVRNPSVGGMRFIIFFLTNNPNVGTGRFLDFFPRGSAQWTEIIEGFRRINPEQGFFEGME